jgi:hypothetical protein
MDGPVAGAVGPIPVGIAVILGCALELILGYAAPVTAEIGIVPETCPGHRVVVLAHSEKATKRHDGVSDLAAHLVDHYSLHGSDLVVVPAVHRRSLDLVAADQRDGLSPIVTVVAIVFFSLWLDARQCALFRGTSIAVTRSVGSDSGKWLCTAPHVSLACVALDVSHLELEHPP